MDLQKLSLLTSLFPSGDNLKLSSGIFKGFPQKHVCISNWVAQSNTDKLSGVGGERKGSRKRETFKLKSLVFASTVRCHLKLHDNLLFFPTSSYLLWRYGINRKENKKEKSKGAQGCCLQLSNRVGFW